MELKVRKVHVFEGRPAPVEGYLAGYALLIDVLLQAGIRVPLPDRLCIISEKHQKYETDQWQILTPRHRPADDLTGHLFFALKYEGIDLNILKAIYLYAGPEAIRQIVMSAQTGQNARRIWFLYEWLLEKPLKIPDLQSGTYVELVDSTLQYPGPTINSTRHRVKNNLPGVREFCPLIRRTAKLEGYMAQHMNERLSKDIGKLDRDLIRRTAAFLLLKDSKASFAIEGEYLPDVRARNWGKIIGEAGKHPLSVEEIEQLQHIVIGSKKLKQMGFRTGEGFIGDHDSDTFSPVPDHISAKASDLPSLMEGLLSTEKKLTASDYDPVLAAATIAFGFVFIHPLMDGNGRIHRYLIHHLLAAKGFVRRDMIFPVSASMLNNLAAYQDALETYSAPRLELIEWTSTDDHNVQITNDTIDLYRYYDLTHQAEYLYSCVEDTIDHIIPEEVDYLRRYDRAASAIDEIVSLPDHQVDLFIKMVRQNEGKLSKSKREKFFGDLSDEEIDRMEEVYREIFQDE